MAKKKSFESALSELELIVREMESGNLSLEDAVKKYEIGIKQSEYCLNLLDKTEKKINLISKDKNGRVTKEEYKE